MIKNIYNRITKTFFFFFCTEWHSHAWACFFKHHLQKDTVFPFIIPGNCASIHILQVRRHREVREMGKEKLESWTWLPPKSLIHSPTFQFTVKWNWHINLKGKRKKENDQIYSVNSGIINNTEFIHIWKEFGCWIEKLAYSLLSERKGREILKS